MQYLLYITDINKSLLQIVEPCK